MVTIAAGPQFGSGWMFPVGGTSVHAISVPAAFDPLPDHVWTFDAAFTGRLVQTVSSDGTADFAYDPRGQLTGAEYDYRSGEAYTFDANGNRTNPGYVTGDHNRLLSDCIYDYQYDSEGNRTRAHRDRHRRGHRIRLGPPQPPDRRARPLATDNRPRTTFLLYAGLLARYDQMHYLERWRDQVGQRDGIHGLWVLVPNDQQALLDQKAIPILGPGQRARIPDSWLRNLHRG